MYAVLSSASSRKKIRARASGSAGDFSHANGNAYLGLVEVSISAECFWGSGFGCSPGSLAFSAGAAAAPAVPALFADFPGSGGLAPAAPAALPATLAGSQTTARTLSQPPTPKSKL